MNYKDYTNYKDFTNYKDYRNCKDFRYYRTKKKKNYSKRTTGAIRNTRITGTKAILVML